MGSLVAAAKAVKLPWFPDVHTTVLFKTAPIRHEYDRNGYPSSDEVCDALRLCRFFELRYLKANMVVSMASVLMPTGTFRFLMVGRLAFASTAPG